MAHILDSKTLNPKNYSFKDTFDEKTNRKTRVWICNHTDDKFVYSWGDKKTIDDLKVFMSNCEKAMKEGKKTIKAVGATLPQAPDNEWIILQDTNLFGISKPPIQKIVKDPSKALGRIDRVKGEIVYLKDRVLGLTPFLKVVDNKVNDKFPYVPVKEKDKLMFEPYYIYVLKNQKDYETSNPELLAKAKAAFGEEFVSIIQSGKYSYAFDGSKPKNQISLEDAGNSVLNAVSYSFVGSDRLMKSYNEAVGYSAFEGGDIEDFRGGDVNFDGSGNSQRVYPRVLPRLSPNRLSPDRREKSGFDSDADIPDAMEDNTKMYFNIDADSNDVSFNMDASTNEVSFNIDGSTNEVSFNFSDDEDYSGADGWLKRLFKRKKGTEVNPDTAKAIADPKKVEYTPEEVQVMYEKSGTKKPLKDWLKSDESKKFLNNLAQFGYALLLTKAQGGSAPSKSNAPDARDNDNKNNQVSFPNADEDKKILGMHPVTFAVTAASTALVLGIGAWLIFRRKG